MYSKFKTTSIMRKIFLFIFPLLFCVFSINAQNNNAEENAAINLVSASISNWVYLQKTLVM